MPRQNMSTTKTGEANRTVHYINVKGVSMLAKVTGGSGTSLNLRVGSNYPPASREKTGIAKRTSLTQTNVWY